MANKLPRLVVKSKSVNERDEESIYRAAPLSPGQGCAPVIRTFNIVPTSPNGTPAGMLPKMHADSSQMQSVMNPVQGPRDAAVRAGIKPPDHSKSNIAAIKELSSLNKIRKMSQEEEARAKVRKPPSPSAAAAARSTSAPNRRPEMQRQPSDGGGGGRDFLRENRVGAAAPVRPPRPVPKGDDGMKYLQKKDFGRVPTYLLQRKIEVLEKQEDEMRAKEAALIPPGMRMLSEEERLETLAVLQRNRQDMERALQALPLRIETPGQIRRRDELEQRMREIEEGLKVFSRHKVLVKY